MYCWLACIFVAVMCRVKDVEDSLHDMALKGT